MKKVVSLCLIVFAAALIAACSSDAPGNPVAPQTASMSSMTAEARSNEYIKVCHHNAEYPSEGLWEWEVIEVDSQAKLKGHCGSKQINNHGDRTAVASGTCTACFGNLNSLSVGADCYSTCLVD